MRKAVQIAVLIMSLLGLAALLFLQKRGGTFPQTEPPPAAPETQSVSVPPPLQTPEPTPAEEKSAAETPVPDLMEQVEEESPEDTAAEETVQRDFWLLSFAGDCTIATLHEWQSVASPINMLYVVGEDMGYPFSRVHDLFSEDDFTMVNLEGTLTDATEPKSKDYRFRAPPRYVSVLTEGGIEAVTLANNHTGDYLETGYDDTVSALTGAEILYTDETTPMITTLPDGPKIGVLAFSTVEIDLPAGSVERYLERIRSQFDRCTEEGCDLILAFLHWGWEYRPEPEAWMRELAHRLADMGCSMVLGSHPHVLQPMELYQGVPIFYSLGNFCFGGHSDPADKDSVIVRQEIRWDGERGYVLGAGELIPCSISSVFGRNDFCPTPMEPGTEAYERVLSKLGVDNARYS